MTDRTSGVEMSSGRGRQVTALRAPISRHCSQRTVIHANEVFASTTGLGIAFTLAPKTSPWWHIASCLPQRDLGPNSITLDFDTVNLQFFDWCTQAWIQHWPRKEDEIWWGNASYSPTCPAGRTHYPESTWMDAANHFEQAIDLPRGFPDARQQLRRSVLGHPPQTASNLPRAHTLCGKHTTSTATMSFHELNPWDQRLVLEAHDAPFVDGTSGLLMAQFPSTASLRNSA